MAFDTSDVERKGIAILRILSESQEPIGARVIAHRLKDISVELGERAVRYHLKLMDERGLTRLVGRDGRVLTEQGAEELGSALVKDKIGLAISNIEVLAFRTNFDYEKRCGQIPVNISLFQKEKFYKAIQAMKPSFEKGFCASNLVKVAHEGEKIGEFTVPENRIALATVCSVVINGVLLKAGIPMDSRFGGILQIRNNKPLRFSELIHYAGSSLDPSEVFIMAKMTAVRELVKRGDGKILANFREIPALCRELAIEVVTKLKEAGLGGVLVMGNINETVCEIPVELNKIGMVLIGGMNPVAAAAEAGIDAIHYAMSTVIDYQDLMKFEEIEDGKYR